MFLEWILLFVGAVVIAAILGFRNANHNYTVGGGMFKNGDDNLNKDEHLDVSDFNYYNKHDKLK